MIVMSVPLTSALWDLEPKAPTCLESYMPKGEIALAVVSCKQGGTSSSEGGLSFGPHDSLQFYESAGLLFWHG